MNTTLRIEEETSDHVILYVYGDAPIPERYRGLPVQSLAWNGLAGEESEERLCYTKTRRA